MILASVCATAGIILGVLAFAQHPTFTRLSRPFTAGILLFASSEFLTLLSSSPHPTESPSQPQYLPTYPSVHYTHNPRAIEIVQEVKHLPDTLPPCFGSILGTSRSDPENHQVC